MSPAESPEQQKLMGIAYGIKQGKIPASYSKEAAKLASTMSEEDLRDFASKAFDGSTDTLNDFISKKLFDPYRVRAKSPHEFKKQGAPPRPGLVFDRQKHRWVRPQQAQAPKPSKKVDMTDKIDAIVSTLDEWDKNDFIEEIAEHRDVPEDEIESLEELSKNDLIEMYIDGLSSKEINSMYKDILGDPRHQSKSLDSFNDFLGKGGPGSGKKSGKPKVAPGKPKLAWQLPKPKAPEPVWREKLGVLGRKSKDKNKCDQLDKLNEYLGKGGPGSGKKGFSGAARASVARRKAKEAQAYHERAQQQKIKEKHRQEIIPGRTGTKWNP